MTRFFEDSEIGALMHTGTCDDYLDALFGVPRKRRYIVHRWKTGASTATLCAPEPNGALHKVCTTHDDGVTCVACKAIMLGKPLPADHDYTEADRLRDIEETQRMHDDSVSEGADLPF